MKKINTIFTVLIVLLASISFLSCVIGEERKYGKIIPKKKTEKELVRRVQDSVFGINENLSLKEAAASNIFSKNIIWDIEEAEKKGVYIVLFAYDIDPVSNALRTGFYDKDYFVFYMFVTMTGSLTASAPDNYQNINESIISPVGLSNMFTRFISSEVVMPTSPGMDTEMREVLEAFKEYKEREGFDETAGYILQSQVPDQLPSPFFNVKAAKFIGRCYTELASSTVQFVGFSLLFDFSLPYLNGKEYKGVGATIYEDHPIVENFMLERLKPESGLEFVYEDKYIYEFYPYFNSPVEPYF
jgi:hypothetical protein